MDLENVADEGVYIERLKRAVCAARPASLDEIAAVQRRSRRSHDESSNEEPQSLVAEYCPTSSSTSATTPANDEIDDIDHSVCVSYELAASRLQLFANVKAGVPRGAYRGLVRFHAGSTQVFLKPRADSDNYWTCPNDLTSDLLGHDVELR